MKLAGIGRLLKETAVNWFNSNSFDLVLLAYYSIFSIAPILVIALAIGGMVRKS